MLTLGDDITCYLFKIENAMHQTTYKYFNLNFHL